MHAAGMLSMRVLSCPPGDIEWQDEMIGRGGLATTTVFDSERVLGHLRADKKTVGDRLGWVLLESKGHPRVGVHVPESEVLAALDMVRAR